MASPVKTKIEVRLTWFGRFTIKFATLACRCGFKLPGRWVKAIVNRSWLIRVGGGEWKSIRLDERGRVLA